MARGMTGIPTLAETADKIMRSNVQKGWAMQYPRASHIDIRDACETAAQMDDVWTKEAETAWLEYADARIAAMRKEFIQTYRLDHCISAAKAILMGGLTPPA